MARDGAGITLPGEFGSGKSTLTPALLCQGYGYVSDELAAGGTTDGGGIFSRGTLTIDSSTVSGNESRLAAGGIFFRASASIRRIRPKVTPNPCPDSMRVRLCPLNMPNRRCKTRLGPRWLIFP